MSQPKLHFSESLITANCGVEIAIKLYGFTGVPNSIKLSLSANTRCRFQNGQRQMTWQIDPFTPDPQDHNRWEKSIDVTFNCGDGEYHNGRITAIAYYSNDVNSISTWEEINITC